ncbi:MAG: hypothetical protein NT076_00360 [Candidatus Pacearchaeota archaeon]|nr:hypothetical protein [Candidatus Pacearchaeota archaeon]
MKKSYPFRNVQATKAFLAIVNEKNNTEEIAKTLKVKRSTVYDYINPLRKIGIVKLKKKGKGFEIDWDNFYNTFLVRWKKDAYSEYKPSDENFRKLDKILVKIRHKLILRELIINYVVNIAKSWYLGGVGKGVTLQNCVEDFHTAIPSLLSNQKNTKKNKKQKLAFECLKEMNRFFVEMSAIAPVALEIAFSEIK